MAGDKPIRHEIRRKNLIALIKISGVKRNPRKTAKIITLRLFEIEPGIYNGFAEADIPYGLRNVFTEKDLQAQIYWLQNSCKRKFPNHLLKTKIVQFEKYKQLVEKYEQKQNKQHHRPKTENSISPVPGSRTPAARGSAPPASSKD